MKGAGRIPPSPSAGLARRGCAVAGGMLHQMLLPGEGWSPSALSTQRTSGSTHKASCTLRITRGHPAVPGAFSGTQPRPLPVPITSGFPDGLGAPPGWWQLARQGTEAVAGWGRCPLCRASKAWLCSQASRRAGRWARQTPAPGPGAASDPRLWQSWGWFWRCNGAGQAVPCWLFHGGMLAALLPGPSSLVSAPTAQKSQCAAELRLT